MGDDIGVAAPMKGNGRARMRGGPIGRGGGG